MILTNNRFFFDVCLLSFYYAFVYLLQNSISLSTLTLSLKTDLSNYFGIALVLVISFLLFKRINHVYLTKISIAHNKNRISLRCLLVHCTSVGSTTQMMSLKDEYYLRFPSFLTIGLCNSFANFLFLETVSKSASDKFWFLCE